MWSWECFTPHPPVLVPEVGRGRENGAGKTSAAMEVLRKLAWKNPPEILLLLSPHAPFSRGLTFTLAGNYGGNFSMFGTSSPRFSFRGAEEKGDSLAAFLAHHFPVTVLRKPQASLDQGALVPLAFLSRSGDEEIPPFRLLLANPIGLSLNEAHCLGRFLTQFKDSSVWSLVASGDLSHRVTPDAPAGYSPLGATFDRTVTDGLMRNDASAILSMKDDDIEEAGECGLRSALVFLGLGEKRTGHFLSYEAPFGVGYAAAFTSLHGAPELARKIITQALSSGRDNVREVIRSFLLFPELRYSAACFVTLTKGGELRGCIGTVLPRRSNLAEEIGENALAAAFEDPRFPPVSANELGELSISVDVLSTPEKIDDLSLLDPRKYGIIVEKNGHRGVLLPDLEGVDSVANQISIATRKAGISSPEGRSVFRFTVHRVKEIDHS